MAAVYKFKSMTKRLSHLSQKLYCRNCGQENPDDATYCQKCGADLKTGAMPSTPNATASSPTPSSTSATGGPEAPRASWQMNSVFKDAIALVRSPVPFMNANRDNDPSIKTLMVNYVAVLAAIPFIATLIGDLWYY